MRIKIAFISISKISIDLSSGDTNWHCDCADSHIKPILFINEPCIENRLISIFLLFIYILYKEEFNSKIIKFNWK